MILTRITAFLLSVVLTTALSACGGSGSSSNDDGGSNRQTYFKAVSGQDSDVLPLLGLREYDNQINAYTIWRECGSTSAKLHTGSEPTPVQELPGPQLFSFNCDLEISFDYSSGKPVVIGTIKNGGVEREIEITLKEISESEFITELNSPEVNFIEYFNAQSAFDQKHRLGRMCEDLFDKDCGDVL